MPFIERFFAQVTPAPRAGYFHFQSEISNFHSFKAHKALIISAIPGFRTPIPEFANLPELTVAALKIESG
jgi:hypothetical protein